MPKNDELATSFHSLRDYLDVIRAKGLVTDILDVDWNIELGAITEVVSFSKKPGALLFDRIKGYSEGFRVATNLYSSPRLQAIALGLPDDVSPLEMVRRWRTISR